MKTALTTTFPESFNNEANARRYRNQATGVGASRVAAEEQGKLRSQRVIDAAPVEQLKCRDMSYPSPNPEADVTGTLRDKVTGKKWKPMETGPHL